MPRPARAGASIRPCSTPSSEPATTGTSTRCWGGAGRRAAPAPPGIDGGTDHPEAPHTEMFQLSLSHGALATSSITRRAWGPDLHHLIDPSTGAPASNGVLQATVWAPTCAEAELLAKDALLLGADSLARPL